MKNLSKAELLSVLDFIFEIQKFTDTDTIYKSMQKLAREALGCEQLLIGTCSDSGTSDSCQLSSLNDLSAENPSSPNISDGSIGVQKWPCQSSCFPIRDKFGNQSSITDITTTEDEIFVCNHSPKSPLFCAVFLGKDKQHTQDQELLESLTPYLSAAIGRILSNVVDSKGEIKPKEKIFLTSREKEILEWVSVGKSCSETGLILSITERTVKFHLQNVYRKLAVVNRAQAVTVAHKHALL